MPTRDITYIIDASAIVNFSEFNPINRIKIFDSFAELMGSGIVVTIDPVIVEVDRNSEGAFELLKPFKNAGIVSYFVQEVIDWNETITNQFTRLIKFDQNPADSLVIALAKVNGYTVISDETERQRPNRKIPRVCKHFGVNHISGRDFLSAENIGMDDAYRLGR